MKQSETAKIVVWVQAVDGRVINDLTVEAWHQLIGNFPFEKVEAVVREHYERQTRQLYPADIVNKLNPRNPDAWMESAYTFPRLPDKVIDA